jgi:hypothetical protein
VILKINDEYFGRISQVLFYYSEKKDFTKCYYSVTKLVLVIMVEFHSVNMASGFDKFVT